MEEASNASSPVSFIAMAGYFFGVTVFHRLMPGLRKIDDGEPRVTQT